MYLFVCIHRESYIATIHIYLASSFFFCHLSVDMPGFAMEAINLDSTIGESKENLNERGSPRSALSPQSQHSVDSIDLAIDGVVDTSIDQLYHNVCEMESSDQSQSSFESYGEESRIDSELRHLAGEIENHDQDNNEKVYSNPEKKKGSSSTRSSPKSKSSRDRRGIQNSSRKVSLALLGAKFKNGNVEDSSGNPDLGPFLLKKTRDMVASGENPRKVLEMALRAKKSFERYANEKKHDLERVLCLHVLAAIYCSLEMYDEAIPVLEQSIEIPALEDGQDHSLAKFAGCMQLGDTYAMLGQIENSLLLYTAGLEIQRQALGESDPRVGETCRYVAEAHVQALQFNDAEKLCQMALDIHRESGSPASLEEAADRRLMGLIRDSKGDHESALEHYVLASVSMASNGNELDVASIDCSIGDAYLSLARYDEAVFAYQKALTVFKSAKGENHPTIASVFVRLADLYNKTGKFRESKSYCQNALRIYQKPNLVIPSEEIASGFIDVSAIYQSMNELEMALKLLKRALRIYGNAPGQQSTVAGIEAQMGVMYYMTGNYSESYNVFKSAISKLRASGEKKSALFGIALNQMGLTCVHRYAIDEAAELFEEARSVLEAEYGAYHPETLGVYSNLAGTYDAMGRLEDAIEILEHVVGMREEKLGTANPDVNDEKKRLGELLKEAGRARNRQSRSLETLLDSNTKIVKDSGIKVL